MQAEFEKLDDDNDGLLNKAQTIKLCKFVDSTSAHSWLDHMAMYNAMDTLDETNKKKIKLDDYKRFMFIRMAWMRSPKADMVEIMYGPTKKK